MQNWSLDEAVALSIGFEPCGDIFEGQDGKPVQVDVVEFYTKRKELIQDNFTWSGMSGPRKNRVGQIVRWFDAVELDVPEPLIAFADKYHGLGLGKSAPISKGTSPKSMDPRERSSMLRLIISLAIYGYAYNPQARRSEIPRDIESDLHKLGLSLSIDTIRSLLKEASALIDSDVLEDLHSSKPTRKNK